MLRIWTVDFVVLILNAGAPLKNEIALRSSQYFCRTQLQSILFLDSIKLIPLGDAVGYINRSPLQDLQLSWVNSRQANMQKRPDKERYFLIASNLLVTLPTSIYYTQRKNKNWFALVLKVSQHFFSRIWQFGQTVRRIMTKSQMDSQTWNLK